MQLYFDVLHLYYIPQYVPVLQELLSKGHKVSMVFYKNQDRRSVDVSHSFINKNSINAIWLASSDDAFNFYQNSNADWIVFGNSFEKVELLNKKTVLMQHGIGPKQCYYDVSQNKTTVRFVEGEHRLARLKSLYPHSNFIDVGYAKLDPIFNQTLEKLDLSDLGLDPCKKTLLYAPTFYPSSIECFSDDFPSHYRDFNIIIKPHHFSLFKQRYKKQRLKLEQWATFNNVYVASEYDFDLTPFLDIADIMISDASSAIFEFAALGKPVVWCDFYKLRWSYKGIFSFRLKARLDDDIEYFHQLCNRASCYEELQSIIGFAEQQPAEFVELRENIIYKLAGKTDGHSAKRIVSYLEEHK
ncbi:MULTISPECIES: CDP-glycerol glycerophosphotransferase family protein [Pseudoalteromonas]|uniref:CDP-glycerol glycerophosphotransferase, TagB/SpsB family n=1 Tax=Pseudoalteromonas lipolytica TaxID=570156 RepID=A0AAD0RXP5_9GAMM|nr:MULTISPECIES: CDP-glycerol glycerophosphotransferase family protein [Pseudoalteromonas]AXV64292.1 CDP-glycerol--poly(glycerophosphate) glycerophosphotransferase [Pseudoalteromonas donghaensis]EWH06498.1 CDP-glycerol glycerophosphotransferase [Pseudoalteromonas lipolytica SCSIO 04301]QLJ08770.1 CDP-glycerol glycerophosphotransferase family protein [Pseudoalteromonas sp. JSTW]QMW15004.1 CDP-glycerol glycerophosphotransferase family protein [Pseudoalteromonas sp. MT33b]SFT57930.1 CDP-glycerol |tara:strand:+ start:1398 stop:2465 length:1068 start_codon:yes stop_codon:yes gene_type:complete